ncbi:MocR-like pyridoxine biosynthesis transcription factor PdxR [Falsirhodobacter sp. 20TX0035]|uniref:MocR-like pyridoxine biosynthesis transcription factor PdxR n=1 Tax=Falsirhodobacter sp. 20TX0035 TaxID=3022019 RepID=UPI0023301F89|nr:PLP-dependent aminotransferase family protein [Falsirhodobacter sp. 20TX0035]MDB6454093.1 PLP-dependent aminotransferase family protein [Falsirhodobacter sp. 20TX0035]
MPKVPTNSPPVDFPLEMDGHTGSQSSRLYLALRDSILSGRVPAGARLPASRALAGQLGLPRNVVVVAYERLLADELAQARTGAGTFVAADVPVGVVPARTIDPPPAPVPAEVFALGRTHAEPQLRDDLRRAVNRRLRAFDDAHLRYGDPRGGRPLREQIAVHLAMHRGIPCDADHIVLVSGTQQGLRLALDTVVAPGHSVWMEDPGYPAARRAIEAAGARVVPVPVDAAGLDVAEGHRRAATAQAVYVTPSHQFPTGVAMSMARRAQLLAWARQADAWILEDDYDGEFRYTGPPLTALAGLDPARRVIYFGTFSKTLFPGLRLGYVVLPPDLLGPFLAARQALDRFPPTLLEGAVADMMARGEVSAHIRRVRSRYRMARDVLADTLEQTAGGRLQVAVPEQGLHLVARLTDPDLHDAAGRLRTQARISGLLLSETRMSPSAEEGFVLGFSGHSLDDIRAGAIRLGQAVKTGGG